MLSRKDLFARRCVLGLVQIIEQLPSRVAVRVPLSVDPPTIGMLLLWTILRWERTYLLVCLEELGVDMWGLTCDLDSLIREHKARESQGDSGAAGVTTPGFSWRELDDCLVSWLEQAEQQAAKRNHAYLGTEHLLLAIIAGADPPLAELLAHHGLEYGRVEDAVQAALARSPGKMQESASGAIVHHVRLGAEWDTPAVGVPRRFGLGILLMMMTMYAVLFAAMQVLGAPPEVFIIVAILFTGVGLGQTLLYEGRYPRAASIWVGAGLLPMEILGLMIHPAARKGSPAEMVALLIISPLLGAGFGYLAGGLTAGVFLLVKEYQARIHARREVEEVDNVDDAEDPEESEPATH